MKTKAPSATRTTRPVKLTATRNPSLKAAMKGSRVATDADFAPAKAAKPSKPTKPGKRVFNKDTFDVIPLVMASARTPMRALMKKLRGTAIPADPTTKRFLVVTGGKGGYVSEVLSDDGDFYARKTRDGGLRYGQISALKDVTGLNIEATITNKAGVVALAAKVGKVVTVANHDKEDVTVALLNPFADKVVAAVTRTPEGRIRVLTMHHVSRNSRPEEQYANPRDVRKPKAFLATLAAK